MGTDFELLERFFWDKGQHNIAGVDEAGRGALAGPVVAAAVIMSPSSFMLLSPEVQDSKALSPGKRERLYDAIQKHAQSMGVGIIEPAEIDRVNILQASLKAMRIAIESLSIVPDMCLIDGNQKVPICLSQQVIVKGDAKIFSIAAASIVAKVTRDRRMCRLDPIYPVYGFAKHKGYGTVAHRKALDQYGRCVEHRKSFSFHHS